MAAKRRYDEATKVAQRAYYTSEHGKAVRKRYRQTAKFKVAQLRYRARRNALSATRRQAIKLQVFTHYCGGPPRCTGDGCSVNTLEVLQLDHINGGGNAHRRQTQHHVYEWVIRHNFPVGFRVLCANCNRAQFHGVSWIPGSRVA